MKPGDIVWMDTTDFTNDGWKAEKTLKHGHLWLVLAERLEEGHRVPPTDDDDDVVHLRSLADGATVTTYKDGLRTYQPEAEEEQPHA